jgi:hypothetical protein
MMTATFVRAPATIWKVRIGSNFFVEVYKPPCRLHRWMQRLCFGFVWTREIREITTLRMD